MQDDEDYRFSDVLGALVSSVAHARSVSDLEALRIAHKYHKNPLLKGLPIPRLRIKGITISLPLILDDVITGSAAEANNSEEIIRKTIKALNKTCDSLVNTLSGLLDRESLGEEEKKKIEFIYELVLSVKEAKNQQIFEQRLLERVPEAVSDLKNDEGGESPSDFAIRTAVGEAVEALLLDILHDQTFVLIRRRVQDDQERTFDATRARSGFERIEHSEQYNYINTLVKTTRFAAEAGAIKSASVPSDLSVKVDTDSIKNAGGGPDTVTRLNMVLHEEGLEWLNEVQGDGSQVNKLMPE